MLLMIDNYDSFTYNLVQYLGELGETVEVYRNKEITLEEIAGKKLNVRVAVRTGDTNVSEKAKMLKKPPHILITTPESLAIVLSSIKFVELLKDVQWCIVDEVHALAENKRGTHLSLSLERLQQLNEKEITAV